MMENEVMTQLTNNPLQTVSGVLAGVNLGLDLDTIYQAPNRQRIMIIDDDPDTLTLLKEILRLAGFDVISACSAGSALKKCVDFHPDIILLDLMMPEVDGWQTFQYLREVTSAPVIIVSARANKDEIVRGLQMGVDDYVTKPFYNEEVIARVKTVLRRARSAEMVTTLVFPHANLVINLETQEVMVRNEPVHLTVKEFSVLAVLAKHTPKSVTYDTIAREVWGESSASARKRIKYLIYLLRRKLEKDPANPALIVNNEALGYKLNVNLA